MTGRSVRWMCGSGRAFPSGKQGVWRERSGTCIFAIASPAPAGETGAARPLSIWLATVDLTAALT